MPPEPGYLDWDEVSTAPERAGAYAWYSKLLVGRRALDSADELLQAVSTQTKRLGAPSVKVRVDGAFGQRWRGVADPSSPESASDSPPAHVLEVVEDPKMRRWLLTMLTEAAPTFLAPLYVGVSGNLRVRLRTHVRHISNIRAREGLDEEITAGEREFAERAVKAGFTQRHLFVAYRELTDDDGLSAAQERTAAEAAEWILNRWTRPSFGRT